VPERGQGEEFKVEELDKPSQGWSVLVEWLDIELEAIGMDDFLLAQLLKESDNRRIVTKVTFFPILIILRPCAEREREREDE
jgi:hypothetical protein